MIEVVSYRNPLDRQIRYYLLDRLSGRQYRRIVGAWSWPGVKAGHLVIVGEDRKGTAWHSLTERICKSIPELLGAVIPLKEYYRVGEWYSDTTNRPAMTRWAEMVDALNVNAAKSGRRPVVDIWPVEAPYVREVEERFPHYCHVIRDVIVPVRRLEWGMCPQVRVSFENLEPEQTGETIERHPEITALGFALAALASFPYSEAVVRGPDYQPLDPFAGY